jgi:hypothetical protein
MSAIAPFTKDQFAPFSLADTHAAAAKSAALEQMAKTSESDRQMKLHKVAAELAAGIVSKMKEAGGTPGTPEFQAKLDAIAQPAKEAMGRMGLPVQDGPTHWESVQALAGMHGTGAGGKIPTPLKVQSGDKIEYYLNTPQGLTATGKYAPPNLSPNLGIDQDGMVAPLAGSPLAVSALEQAKQSQRILPMTTPDGRAYYAPGGELTGRPVPGQAQAGAGMPAQPIPTGRPSIAPGVDLGRLKQYASTLPPGQERTNLESGIAEQEAASTGAHAPQTPQSDWGQVSIAPGTDLAKFAQNLESMPAGPEKSALQQELSRMQSASSTAPQGAQPMPSTPPAQPPAAQAGQPVLGADPALLKQRERQGLLPVLSQEADIKTRQAQQEEVSKAFGKQYSDVQSQRVSAIRSMDTYGRLGQLLGSFDTGKLTPIGMSVSGALSSLGVNVDPKLGAKQAFEAVANELTLGKIGAGGMPSNNFSDADRAFLQRTIPNLATTKDGNAKIIEYAKNVAARNIETANRADAYYKAHNGMFDGGFWAEEQKYAQEHPLFGESAGAAGAAGQGGKIKFMGFK